MQPIVTEYFSREIFHCYFAENTRAPLVVSPADETIDIIGWTKRNQRCVDQAIAEFGAVVFSGFNLEKEHFPVIFEAATGMKPDGYTGDTPRRKVGENIYESTAVASGHALPLHQEVSVRHHADMPRYISFFCVTPSKPGTGQTQVGSAAKVSEEIERLMPRLWKQMKEHTITYTARYLPENSWRTRWIQWLNPSHGTIKARFGTTNHDEIAEKCRQEGLSHEWDGDWLVVSRKGVPAIITVNGRPLFCNQMHVDTLSPKLCGGWIHYFFATLLLYPTKRSLQFEAKFDNGASLGIRDANRLLSILERHSEGRDWKKGDFMILDNRTTMHAKTVHSGAREIQVAMAGSAAPEKLAAAARREGAPFTRASACHVLGLDESATEGDLLSAYIGLCNKKEGPEMKEVIAAYTYLRNTHLKSA